MGGFCLVVELHREWSATNLLVRFLVFFICTYEGIASVLILEINTNYQRCLQFQLSPKKTLKVQGVSKKRPLLR